MQENLIKLGLSENEASVYLAVLELGPAVASSIANQAKVKRPTTYLALENLIKLGLVSQIVDSKEKMFKAEEPDRLIKLTKKMRRQVIEAEIELEKLLPGLKAIQKNIVEAPKLTYHKGIEAVRNIIVEAAGYPEPWYYFGSTEAWMKVLSEKGVDDFSLETREVRKKAGRPTNYIITDESYNKIKIFQKQELINRQVKILTGLSKAKSAFIIFGKKLGVLNLSQSPFGAVIESGEVVEVVKVMYQLIWKSLS